MIARRVLRRLSGSARRRIWPGPGVYDVRKLTHKPIKVCCPGPLTIVMPITPRGGYQGDYMPLLYDLAELVNRELKQVVAAGATFIQIDEPSAVGRTPVLPVEETVALFNKTVEGLEAKIALHICFGNNQGRPAMKRTYRPLFPGILEAKAEQIALEFSEPGDVGSRTVERVRRRAGAGRGCDRREVDVSGDAGRCGRADSDRFAACRSRETVPDL